MVYEVEIFLTTPVFQVPVYIYCFPQEFFVSGCDTRYRSSQFLFILTAKLMIPSANCWGSCFAVTSFVPTCSIT